MKDISMRTPNAQKYIRYGWAAWDAVSKGNKKEFRHILNERRKFRVENFTLEDYDSMLEDSKSYTPAYLAWERAKERYIAEHQQNEIKVVRKKYKNTNKTLKKNCLK